MPIFKPMVWRNRRSYAAGGMSMGLNLQTSDTYNPLAAGNLDALS